MNASHCYMQNPPWTRGLTNYFDDDWLCIANIVPRLNLPISFAHPFGGGSLMINLLSHLIAKEPPPKLGCKLGSMIINNIFLNAMIPKNMIKK